MNSILNMFSLITKQISKAPLSTSFLSPRCSTVPIASSGLSDSEGVGKIGPSEEKKKGKGGGGRNGRRACKTFFNGSVLVFQLLVYPLIGQFCQFLSTSAKRVICVIHDNQYYPENASRARFRGIQVMSHFARMSPAFSTTNVFYMF